MLVPSPLTGELGQLSTNGVKVSNVILNIAPSHLVNIFKYKGNNIISLKISCLLNTVMFLAVLKNFVIMLQKFTYTEVNFHHSLFIKSEYTSSKNGLNQYKLV